MQAILHTLHPVRARVHTLAWDNGSEFAEHALIDIALDARSYFADSYSSWQRGTNENMTIPFLGPMVCCASTCPRVATSVPTRTRNFNRSKTNSTNPKTALPPSWWLGFRTPQRVFDASFKRAALRS
jgi:hypothetical protein